MCLDLQRGIVIRKSLRTAFFAFLRRIADDDDVREIFAERVEEKAARSGHPTTIVDRI